MTECAAAIEELLGPAAGELPAVEHVMRQSLNSGDRILQAPAMHILFAGGKRLRPALLLLSARAFNYDASKAVPAAAAVEMIHAATLIHDDIIDDADSRRGVPSVNSKWDTRTALLTGDYLLARAFLILAGLRPRMLAPLARAVEDMCGGQAEEIALDARDQACNRACDEDVYLKRIERKTAMFMSSCCALGAMLGRATGRSVTALSEYGRHLGIAFQITDDLLDICGDPDDTGKPPGLDAGHGILTLPVIHGLKTSPDGELRELLQSRSRHNDKAWMSRLASALYRTGSLDYARDRARVFACAATCSVAGLRASPAKDALFRIAEYVAQRA